MDINPAGAAVADGIADRLLGNPVDDELDIRVKTGRIILQQPVSHEELHKLLAEGRTSLLDGFVSNKTRRKFKAFLAWNKAEGKVGFEFEPRAARPAAKKAAARKTA